MSVITNAWSHFSTWSHSSVVKELYRKRARKESEIMTCHVQLADLLSIYGKPGDTLCDVGCGAAYLFHAVQNLKLNYFGFDAEEEFIAIAKEELCSFGLDPNSVTCARIEDFFGTFDHVVSINVLTYLDNFHKPLERMLLSTKKTVIIRESIARISSYKYVVDEFLDDNVKLKTYINTYSEEEVISFIESYGFSVCVYEDTFCGGSEQNVIGYPHFWKFIVATKKE